MGWFLVKFVNLSKKIMRILFLSLFIASYSLAQDLTVERIWRSPEFYGNYVDGFTALSDGEHFTKITKENGKSVLKKYAFKDLNGAGETVVVLSDIQFEGSPLEYDDVTLSKSGKLLLLQQHTESIYRHSYSTTYFVYHIANKKTSKIHSETEKQTLATFSPDESKIAYVAGNNLYVYDLSTDKSVALTNDGKQNAIINGTTDWVYEEEFAITQGFDWSPDSKYIGFMRFDERAVKEFQMAMYGNLYPEAYTFKYPKAGEDNSKVNFHIVNVVTKAISEVPLTDYEYIPKFAWSPINNELIVLTMNRHQSVVKYHLIQQLDKPTVRIIYEEKSDTYLEVDNFILLNDGRSILRTSEADGYNHIYRLNMDGTQKQLTKGNWDVIDLYGTDPKNTMVYFTSSEHGAINKTIHSVDLKKGTKAILSPATGYHDATFATGFKYFVRQSSTVETVNTFTLCDNKGKTVQVLEDNAALQKRVDALKLPKKEFMQIQGVDQPLNAWMIKPVDFDPNKKYPVYFTIYCGPGSNQVNNAWGGTNYMYHQLLAQKGYIVFCVDTRGTQFRGAAFKKSTYLQLGKLESEDILAVAENLKKLSYVDGNRLGIQGWSYGGFMTSLAMTKGKSMFKMGIAVAPVTNWRYYDNIYTERFMRTPQENASGYDDNSPINFAKGLTGKFLLIHGSADDNVHYQNTMEFITTLVNANKQFDLFIYPNKNHGIYGGNTRNHLYTMMLDYTLKNL
jgi:dipeptidyl-peptidase-4